MFDRRIFTKLFLLTFLTSFGVAGAAETTVPEPFRGFDDTSEYVIKYDDLTEVLKTVVVDMGRSNRNEASEAPEVTGTRMKTKVKKTANEGNRFYFETFKDNEEARAFLLEIQDSLEHLPDEAPLSHFSRDEQLAYWLNLYNVTVLNQVIDEYPRQNLKRVFRGRNSIFEEKLLTVAGVPLSLSDIQFTILKQNYDANPLVIYGLYQGIIGGPNIRKSAYTGANVWGALENNAYEFINSNRGTYMTRGKTFRVSRFYERSKPFFPNFQEDLPAHLLKYLQGPEKPALQAASKVKPNIDDWDVTDLGGSHRRIGGSFADSRAALLDSVKSTVPNTNEGPGGGTLAASVGYGSSSMAAKGKQLSLARIDPALLEVLHDIDDKRMQQNIRRSNVTIEDVEAETGEEAQDKTSAGEDTD